MNILNLKSVTRKPKAFYPRVSETFISDNILDRQFNPDDVDSVWVTDFTYLKYNHGKSHIWLSGVLDLFSREIISWTVSDQQTAQAAVETFAKAFNDHPDVAPMVHSDRGASYTAQLFHDFLEEHDCKQSMSRPGTPHDNSIMESWWSLFKTDWFYREAMELKEISDVMALIEDGISYFNNERRTKRSNGLTPHEMRESAA